MWETSPTNLNFPFCTYVRTASQLTEQQQTLKNHAQFRDKVLHTKKGELKRLSRQSIVPTYIIEFLHKYQSRSEEQVCVALMTIEMLWSLLM